jgi:hypothetical protein
MFRSFRFALALAALAALSSVRLGLAQDAAATTTNSDPIYLDEPTVVPPPVVVTSGPLEDKYDDGKIRIHREVRKMSDDTLVNHGAFIEYYPNGQKFVEGSTTARGPFGTTTARSARQLRSSRVAPTGPGKSSARTAPCNRRRPTRITSATARGLPTTRTAKRRLPRNRMSTASARASAARTMPTASRSAK